VGLAFHDFVVGLWGFGEREFEADDGAEGSGFECGGDGGVDAAVFVGGGVAEHDAANVGITFHGFAGVDFDGAAAADDDDASAFVENGEVFCEVLVGEHFENDVDSAVGGELFEFFGSFGDGVVGGLMGALLESEGAAFFVAGGGDDGESGSAGELDCGDADTAGAAVDEDGFAGFTLGAIEEGVVGDAGGDADGGALLEGGVVGEWVDGGEIAEGFFGVGAGEGCVGVDAVADFEFGDGFTNGVDSAGGVFSGSIGEWHGAVLAGADVGIDGVDADGVDADDDLATRGFGVGDFFEFQDFGAAELADSNGFHGGSPG